MWIVWLGPRPKMCPHEMCPLKKGSKSVGSFTDLFFEMRCQKKNEAISLGSITRAWLSFGEYGTV